MSNPASKLSPWWRHGALLVMIFGFSILIFMTVLAYHDAPPIPATVVDASGQVLFTGKQIEHGQSVFLQHALMEHGTLWGHGAYLGPDYGTEYLHRSATVDRDYLAEQRLRRPYAQLDLGSQAVIAQAVKADEQTNRYDASSKTLTFTAGQAQGFQSQVAYWTNYFTKPNAAPGLPAKLISSPTELHDLTAYFAWAAWAEVSHRPGKTYSYTNNFPPEPLVGNRPATAAYVWSAVSLLFLLGGLGAILFLLGKFDYLGWRGNPEPIKHDHHPLRPATLTKSQWATGAIFAVVALLFLLQSLAGGALAHYWVEPNGFYGFKLANWIPYNILRTWHLQLAIFWIAAAWIAGGLFLAPLVGGREPKGQATGVYVLLGALVLVTLGSLFGEYIGVNGWLGHLWFWLGHQGSEYLDLGRFWQILLAGGLAFWLALMYRALKPAIKDPEKGELASLFLYAAVAIPLFYVPALFYGPHTNFAVIDNWRFWIIHLWVEGFFELFATVIVAIIFTQMGLVSARHATRLIYLDVMLYLGGGLVGTAHHWYFTGQPQVSMALGACFSALEVVPLTLLTLDAWDFIRLGRSACAECGQEMATNHRWTIRFLMAVGFWNFVGAGVFGFFINLPIVSYFEIGTTLTANHGHAAMFGVFGMLALAVLMFALRSMQSDTTWATTERWVRVGFWGLNGGLALMLVLDLFPAGVLQLWQSITHGYWSARQLTFTMTGTFHVLAWVRIAGDMTFLLVGVVPIVVATLHGFLKRDVAVEPAKEESPGVLAA